MLKEIEDILLDCCEESFKNYLNEFDNLKQRYLSISNNNNILTLMNESVLRYYVSHAVLKLNKNIKITAEYPIKRSSRKNADLYIETNNIDEGVIENALIEFKIEKDDITVGYAIRDMIYDAIRISQEEVGKKYTILLIYPKWIEENINKKKKRKWKPGFFSLLNEYFVEDEDDKREINIPQIAEKIKGLFVVNNQTKDKSWIKWFELCENSNLKLVRKLSKFNNEKEVKITLYEVKGG